MPGVTITDGSAKKRKRTEATAGIKPTSSTKSKKLKAAAKAEDGEDAAAQMLLLEQQILESPSHYENITVLLKLAQKKSKDVTQTITAAVALCRVFCRLMAQEKMIKMKQMDDEQIQAVDWLKAQYKEYARVLAKMLVKEELQSTALTLMMRLVKEETSHDGRRSEQAWRTGVFAEVISGLLSSPDAAGAREEFIEKYLQEHDDVRYFTFYQVA